MSAAALSQHPLPPSFHDGFLSVLASQLGPLSGRSVRRTATPPPGRDPVDMDRLLEMVDDQPAQLREIVALYLKESERGMSELWASVQAGDWDQSERLAHRLAGTAATCGMIGLVGPLRELEIVAQSGRWSRIQALLLEALRQQALVLECLEGYGLKQSAAAPRVLGAGR